MARLRIRYVNAVHKSGRTYFYFRRPGFKRVPLPGLPCSSEFMSAYQAALSGGKEVKLEIGAGRTIPGTISATIAAFYASHKFIKNEPITRRTDRNILEAFRAKHGHRRIALLERRHVEAMIAEKADKPSAQRNLLRTLRVLLNFAVEQKLRPDNPALGIKLHPIKTDGFHSWTEDELVRYEQRHPIGTRRVLRSRCCSIQRDGGKTLLVWVPLTCAAASFISPIPRTAP